MLDRAAVEPARGGAECGEHRCPESRPHELHRHAAQGSARVEARMGPRVLARERAVHGEALIPLTEFELAGADPPGTSVVSECESRTHADRAEDESGIGRERRPCTARIERRLEIRARAAQVCRESREREGAPGRSDAQVGELGGGLEPRLRRPGGAPIEARLAHYSLELDPREAQLWQRAAGEIREHCSRRAPQPPAHPAAVGGGVDAEGSAWRACSELERLDAEMPA